MPTTRSSARNAKAGPSKQKASNGTVKVEADVESSLSELSDTEPSTTVVETEKSFDVESYLNSALSGVQDLKKQLNSLKRKNADLQAEINRLHDAEDVSIQPKRGRRGGMSPQALQARVKKLEREVANLEKARERDRKKIKKLKLREVDEDVAELRDELENGGDTFDRMRKLLRRFDQIVSTPSYEDEEECVICSEKIENKNPISLACEHILCKPCLHELLKYHSQPDTPEPKCPTCRAPIAPDLEGTEAVTWNATAQWDALLEVAQEWARIDKHGGDEPEETEEEEVPFIDDEDGESSAAQSEQEQDPEPELQPDPAPEPGPTVDNAETGEGAAANDIIDDNPPENQDELLDNAPSPPQTPRRQLSRTSYFQSPSSVKRKRLEELAQSRKKKATVW